MAVAELFRGMTHHSNGSDRDRFRKEVRKHGFDFRGFDEEAQHYFDHVRRIPRRKDVRVVACFFYPDMPMKHLFFPKSYFKDFKESKRKKDTGGPRYWCVVCFQGFKDKRRIMGYLDMKSLLSRKPSEKTFVPPEPKKPIKGKGKVPSPVASNDDASKSDGFLEIPKGTRIGYDKADVAWETLQMIDSSQLLDKPPKSDPDHKRMLSSAQSAPEFHKLLPQMSETNIDASDRSFLESESTVVDGEDEDQPVRTVRIATGEDAGHLKHGSASAPSILHEEEPGSQRHLAEAAPSESDEESFKKVLKTLREADPTFFANDDFATVLRAPAADQEKRFSTYKSAGVNRFKEEVTLYLVQHRNSKTVQKSIAEDLEEDKGSESDGSEANDTLPHDALADGSLRPGVGPGTGGPPQMRHIGEENHADSDEKEKREAVHALYNPYPTPRQELEIPRVGRNRKAWKVGMRLDVKNYGVWYAATIKAINEKADSILVGFDGYHIQHDQWLKRTALCLAPLHKFSKTSLQRMNRKSFKLLQKERAKVEAEAAGKANAGPITLSASAVGTLSSVSTWPNLAQGRTDDNHMARAASLETMNMSYLQLPQKSASTNATARRYSVGDGKIPRDKSLAAALDEFLHSPRGAKSANVSPRHARKTGSMGSSAGSLSSRSAEDEKVHPDDYHALDSARTDGATSRHSGVAEPVMDDGEISEELSQALKSARGSIDEVKRRFLSRVTNSSELSGMSTSDDPEMARLCDAAQYIQVIEAMEHEIARLQHENFQCKQMLKSQHELLAKHQLANAHLHKHARALHDHLEDHETHQTADIHTRRLHARLGLDPPSEPASPPPPELPELPEFPWDMYATNTGADGEAERQTSMSAIPAIRVEEVTLQNQPALPPLPEMEAMPH